MQDVINSGFEFLGGLFIAMTCLRLYRDKQVKGVSPIHITYFTFWGYWNLYYYPSIDQWWSFWGGVGVVFTNTIWLAMVGYYGVFNAQRPLVQTDGQPHPGPQEKVVQAEDPS